jgi:hypothetical protein
MHDYMYYSLFNNELTEMRYVHVVIHPCAHAHVQELTETAKLLGREHRPAICMWRLKFRSYMILLLYRQQA